MNAASLVSDRRHGCRLPKASHAGSVTENTMETLLTLWYVFAVLIWNSIVDKDRDPSPRVCDGTSKPRLDYIAISPALLSEWEAHQSNLIIIDLRAKTDFGSDGDANPSSCAERTQSLWHKTLPPTEDADRRYSAFQPRLPGKRYGRILGRWNNLGSEDRSSDSAANAG
jgi:hypothetical protein